MSKLEREKSQDAKRIREQEQRRHTVALTEQRARWHEEKQKELQASRETLARQHEQELARVTKVRDAENQRLKAALSAVRDGGGERVRTALTLEAREDARRFFDQERVRLLQEIAEIRASKKQADQALSDIIQADRMKAGDLRSEHQLHQEELSKMKWDCERNVRRLVSASPPYLQNAKVGWSTSFSNHSGSIQRPIGLKWATGCVTNDKFISRGNPGRTEQGAVLGT